MIANSLEYVLYRIKTYVKSNFCKKKRVNKFKYFVKKILNAI